MFKRSKIAILFLGLALVAAGSGGPAAADDLGFSFTPDGGVPAGWLDSDAPDGPWRGVPDLKADSAKFLVVSGLGNFAIGQPGRLVFRLTFDAGKPVRIGVFDGDTVGLWDQRDNLPPVSAEVGLTNPYSTRYRLVADPDGSLAAMFATGGEPLPPADPKIVENTTAKEAPFLGTDNRWCEYANRAVDASALDGPTGKYRYTFVVDIEPVGNATLTGFEMNGFKLALNGRARLAANTIAGFVGGAVDVRVVRNGIQTTEDPLPGLAIPDTNLTNQYDGNFEFPFDTSRVCEDLMFSEADADWQDPAAADELGIIRLPRTPGGDLDLAASTNGIPPDDAAIYEIPDPSEPTGVRLIDNRSFLISGQPLWEIVGTDGSTVVFSSNTDTVIGHASTTAANTPANGGAFQTTTLSKTPFQSDPGQWYLRWHQVDSRNSIWIKASVDLGDDPDPTGGIVFCDENGNDMWDEGEPGLEGVELTLQKTAPQAGSPFQVTTDADGRWTANLEAGTYEITAVNQPDPPYGVVGIALPIEIDVCAGGGDVPIDCAGMIFGRVWCDFDENQEWNSPPDAALEGFTVRITPTNPAGAPIEVLTNLAGQYMQTVPAGEYTVEVIAPMFFTGTLLSTSPVTGVQVENGGSAEVNFRYRCTEACSGQVFCDQDDNGFFSPGDIPLEGVTVTISLQGGGVPPVELMTDANGEFTTDLPPGTYDVSITPPAGTTSKGPTTQVCVVDLDDALNPPLAFPLVCEAQICGKVYCDNDNDGEFGPGDEAIEGQTCRATPVAIPGVPLDAVTNADGEYCITVPPGTYDVSIVSPPPGSILLSPSPVRVTLTFGERKNVDFRLRCPARLSGRVVLEKRPCDGVTQPGESGIAGVEIVLETLDEANMPTGVTRTTLTNATGNYEFTDVDPGKYRVYVADGEVADYAPTPGTVAVYGPIAVEPFSNTTDLDFWYCPGVIRVVVVKKTGDCVNTCLPEDVPLQGVLVDIVGTNPVRPPAIAATGPDGSVTFDNLPAGEWRITVADGQPLLIGLDPAAPEAVTTLVTLPPGGEQELCSAWCEMPCAITGRVLYQEGCIPFWSRSGGIAGVSVELREAAAPPASPALATAITNVNGEFLFEDLQEGTSYRVSVPPGQGPLVGLTVVGANPVVTEDCPADVEFTYGTAGLEAQVFFDLDCDGIPDSLAGAQDFPVRLENLNTGEVWVVPTSLLNGAWSARFPSPAINGLLPGAYRVSIEVPAGWIAKGPTSIDVRLPLCDLVQVQFNLCGTGSIVGCVIKEIVLCDGTRQEGEPTIPGVKVTLTPVRPAGMPAVTFTGRDGCYAFTGLPRGLYRVEIDAATDPVLVGLEPSTPESVERIVIPPAEERIDFFLCPPGRIRGIVFREPPGDDCDGVYNNGDVGLGGITVCFTPSDPTMAAAFCVQTAPDGTFDSGLIPPMDWTVQVDGSQPQLVNLSASTPLVVGPFPVPPGGEEYVEFGFCPQELHGIVFREPVRDCDGIYNEGDVGIGGVEVVLVPVAPPGPARQTTTNPDGTYAFLDIPVGLYDLFVSTTPPQQELVGLEPSSPTLLTPFVGPHEIVTDQNFGYCPELRQICGTVFREPVDRCDGIYNEGDVGIGGVTVTIAGLDFFYEDQTLTDRFGDYCFRDLEPGRYVVTVDPNQPLVVDLTPSTPSSLEADATELDVEDVDFGFCPEDECKKHPCCEGDIHEVVVETKFWAGRCDGWWEICAQLYRTCDSRCELDWASAWWGADDLPGPCSGPNEIVSIENIWKEDGWIRVRLRLTAQGCAFPRGFFGDLERKLVVTAKGWDGCYRNEGCVAFRCEKVRPGSRFTWSPACGFPDCEPTDPLPGPTLVASSVEGCDCPPECDARFTVIDVWGWEDWIRCVGKPDCKEQSDDCTWGYNLVEVELDYECTGYDHHEYEVALKRDGCTVIDGLWLEWYGQDAPIGATGWGGYLTLIGAIEVEPGHWKLQLRVQQCDRIDGNPGTLPDQLQLCTTMDAWRNEAWLDLNWGACQPCLEVGPRIWQGDTYEGWGVLRWVSVADAAWCPPVRCGKVCDPCSKTASR